MSRDSRRRREDAVCRFLTAGTQWVWTRESRLEHTSTLDRLGEAQHAARSIINVVGGMLFLAFTRLMQGGRPFLLPCMHLDMFCSHE